MTDAHSIRLMPPPAYFFHLAIDLHRPSAEYVEAGRGSSSSSANPLKLVGGPSISCSLLLGDALSSVPSDHDNDWRLGRVAVLSVDMAHGRGAPLVSAAPSLTAPSGLRFGSSLRTDASPFATQGRFEPLESAEAELGWGIVRLYRDREESPGLYDDTGSSRRHAGRHSSMEGEPPGFKDEDCTTLCILAVPSYLTPADFLGFVGEKTRDDVSHFRMIRTDRINRYMVLMKFRSGKRARQWQREWNGKPFNDVEVSVIWTPETCASCLTLPRPRIAMLSLSSPLLSELVPNLQKMDSLFPIFPTTPLRHHEPNLHHSSCHLLPYSTPNQSLLRLPLSKNCPHVLYV